MKEITNEKKRFNPVEVSITFHVYDRLFAKNFLQATKMNLQNLARVKEHSNALLGAIMQSDADLQSRLNACKRVEAVIVALEAPNVPWNEVIGLLNHPSVTAFLAALNLIQFLIALAK